MRRKIYRGSEEQGRALFAGASQVTIAGAGEGRATIKVVHPVVIGEHLVFHGASAGEKMRELGSEVVASVTEQVAVLPSYFFDERRACPATTYYLSAQARGVLERVTDLDEVAMCLRVLMEQYQPEGGYVPITAGDEMYAKVVRGILVARLPLDDVVAKVKVGQNLKGEKFTRMLGKLWARGERGDARAVAMILAHHPAAILPEWLRGDGYELAPDVCDDVDIRRASELLASAYWHEGSSPAERCGALGASEVIGARSSETGELIALARIVSDYHRRAWLYDVIVAPEWRGRGVGRRVIELALSHPACRGVKQVLLGTRDAMVFYERFGFERVGVGPGGSVQMRKVVR